MYQEESMRMSLSSFVIATITTSNNFVDVVIRMNNDDDDKEID
jgi:hypothetical protein